MNDDAILRAENLVKDFRGPRVGFRRETVHAVRDVSFTLAAGRTLAVVGESGSGKTTVAKMVMGFDPPTSGAVWYRGDRISGLRGRRWRELRKEIQYVFQDPYASLPGRRTVAAIVREPLRIHAIEPDNPRKRVDELLELVGLSSEHATRYPHQLSGGQRQRVGIARALAVQPRLLVLDEPVSALDVSVQAQVINLLSDLQAELGVSYLFIAHDLAVVRHIAHDVAVMRNGELLEVNEAAAVFTDPQHEYTKLLLSSVPIADPRLRSATTTGVDEQAVS